MSYFAPTLTPPTTVDIATSGVGSAGFSGEAFTGVITLADPKLVVGIVNSTVAWQHQHTDHVRGLAVYEGLAYYGVGTKIRAVNPKTGYVHYEWTFPKAITAIWIGKPNPASSQHLLLVGYAASGVDNVAMWEITKATLSASPVHLVNESVSNPRGVALDGSRIYIADTFNHRVIITRTNTGHLDTTFPHNEHECWYPNDVRVLSDWSALICEEHANRILSWNPNTNDRTLVVAAPVAPFNDVEADVADIETGTPGTGAEEAPFTPIYDPPKSQCAMEYQSGLTLYSPNQAFYKGADLVVADTDNNRVIVIRSGAIVSAVTGINNPVNVVLT